MKKNRTARALLLSALSLLLCMSMLVGSTFAWFTDSVVSANNIIKSGNLDVELYYQVEGMGDWAEVTESTNIFMEGALWEPGHTEVVKLKVVNAGTLALKYQLGVNVASETGSVSVLGNDFLLSDFIKFGIVEGEKDYNREQAIDAVDEIATPLKQAYNKTATMLTTGEEFVVTMVVYMPTEVDNRANYAKGEAQPVINLGINLFATQFTHELDSFDKYYDALANPWDGQVDTSWYDPAATEFIIDTPEKMAGFAAIVNGTAADIAIDSFLGKTVKLAADIDLGSRNWTPIGDVDADDYVGFRGTFDGQGHTIYNLKIESESWGQGLFGYLMDKGAVIKNFTMRNASVKAADTSAVVAGYATYGDFENVHVTGTIAVEGKEHMGGIVGNGYFAKFKGCSVTANGTITATTGSFVAGIVGYQGEGNLSITDCTVKNVNITGYAAVGGIAGVASASNTIDNCLVENVVLTKTRDGGMPAIGAITGCYTHGGATRVVTITNCTATNVTLKGNYEAADPNVLCGSEYTSQTGTIFALDGNDITVDNQLVKKVSVIKVNTADELKDALKNAVPGTQINAENVTMYPTGSIDTTVHVPAGVTLKGATFVGNSQCYLVTEGDGEDIVFDDCQFNGPGFGMFVIAGNDADGANMVFEGCTFKGQIAPNFVNNANGKATFVDCTFTLGSDGIGLVNCMGGTHTFTNCTFDYAGGATFGSNQYVKWNAINSYSESYSTAVILEGCTRINCGTQRFGGNSTLTIK